MNKPQLDDFDLTQSDLTKYETQKTNYNEMLNKLGDARHRWNRVITTLCVLLFLGLFIAGCVFWSKSLNDSGDYSTITIVLLLLSFIGCPLLGYLFHLPEWALSKFEKWKVGIFNSSQSFHTDKSYYIDSKLGLRIEQFNRATSLYNDYLAKSKKEFWVNLDPYEFEIEVAKLFEKHKYSAYLTKGSGDGGVDIILDKNGQKIAVQCKHHASPVGPNYIRELIGVTASQDYSACIFVSLNGYTKTAENEARQSKVKIELLSLPDLISLNEG